MFTIRHTQLKAIDVAYFDKQIELLISKLSHFSESGIVNEKNLKKWVGYGEKYGFLTIEDVYLFVEFCITHPEMRDEPYQPNILFYLTHPDIPAQRKLELIEKKFFNGESNG